MSAETAVRHPRPTPGKPRAYHFPRFERRELSNGIALTVAPVHKLPVVTLMFVFRTGAADESNAEAGVAQLTARALLEGTSALTGDELTLRFESLGASAEAYAGWDSSALTITALAERTDEMFALAAQVLRDPGFRERDVERLKAERLADLLQLRAEPRGLADESFARILYRDTSRYSRPEDGDEAGVRALDAARVREFHRAHYAPGSMNIVVAGDATTDRIAALAERHFGDWRGTAPRNESVDDAPKFADRRIHLIAKPDAAQSELRVGHVGAARSTPDYFALVVMNAILGGLFSSRINLNLREAHGYTYGAFSGFEWRRARGPFVVSSAVRTEVTTDAVREVLNEIERIRLAPVTESELSLATSYLDGVFPIRYETSAAIAAALASMITYALPSDYFDTYRERIRSVSASDVQRVAGEYLDPERLQVVVVGEPTLEESLASLGLPISTESAQ